MACRVQYRYPMNAMNLPTYLAATAAFNPARTLVGKTFAAIHPCKPRENGFATASAARRAAIYAGAGSVVVSCCTWDDGTYTERLLTP